MPKHPHYLYYLEKNSAKQYSSIPQGILNIARMVQGKSQYWQMITPDSQEKFKNLVFADWSVRNWSSKKRDDVKKLINQLLKDGFTFYVWLEGDLEKITRADQIINAAEYRQVTPAYFDEILAIGARRHKLTFENTYIFDDHRINLLLGKPENDPRQLNLFNFLTIDSDKQQKIIQILEQATPPVAEILIDTYEPATSKYRLQVQALWPKLRIIYKYEHLNFLNLNPSTGYPALSRETIAQPVFLYYIVNEPSNRLEELISLEPVVNGLYLNKNSDFSKLQQLNINALETLAVSDLDKPIDVSCYPNLNHAIPQLKNLYLNKAGFINADLETFNTERLETLKLSSPIQLDVRSLNQLLSNAKQLYKLCMINCKLIGELNEDLAFKLDNLLTIVLDINQIHTIYLRILKAAEHVKYLNLANLGQYKPFGQELRFDELETFHSFNALVLLDWFENSTKLQLMHLSSTTLTKFSKLSGAQLKLNQLNSLTLSYCSIEDSSVLYDLLKASATTLTHLDLSNSLNNENAKDYIWPSGVTMHTLTKLDVTSSWISDVTLLKAIISNAPHLKIINLNNSLVYDDANLFDWLADCELSALEILDLDNISIKGKTSNSSLNQFLSKITSLNYLNLRKWSEKGPINGAFDHLESLNLSKSHISTNDLKITLKGMPNLKQLNIEECPHVRVDNELQGLLDKIEKVLQAPSQFVASYPSQVNATRQNKPVLYKGKDVQQLTTTQAGIDSQTQKKEAAFNLKRIFYSPFDQHHPEIAYYRLETFDSASLAVHLDDRLIPFILSNTKDIALKPVVIEQKAEDVIKFATKGHIYGKQIINLSSQWQPIASLSAAETMTHFHVSPAVEVDIHYSNRDNLYYIKSKNNDEGPVLVDFLIQSPVFIQPELSKTIQATVNTFRAFKEGELKISKPNPQSVDFLNAMLEQKLGACRHRAAAFKLYMEKEHPELPVRIVSNGCHMFVEIKQNEHWILTDLGGYPAQLNIDEAHKPSNVALADKVQRTVEYVTPRQKQFLLKFETWRSKETLFTDNKTAFFHALLQENTKSLIQLPQKHLQSFNITLQAYAKDHHHPIFYAHTPDDLICSAPIVKCLSGNRGILQEGPGGPLHDFLTKTYDVSVNTPIILVNYANFLPDDIVRFNSLLDKIRSADGTPVPKNTRIVGLIDPHKPGSYQGGDFYSRFGAIQVCPPEIIPELPAVFSPETPVERVIINLCHSITWETQLLGGWTLQAGQLYFEEGELVDALRKNLPIEIQNPPDDERFDLVLRQARLHQFVQCNNGERIAFSDGQIMLVSDGYAWPELLENVAWDSSPKPNAHILNSTLLNGFIENYQVKDKQLGKYPGLLKQHAGQSLDVFLTQTMTPDQWGFLLNETKKNKVKLKIACAPGVTLPNDFPRVDIENFPQKTPWDYTLNERTQLIESTDCDLTVAKIKQQSEEKWLIIDVSELSSTDLLNKTDGKLIKQASIDSNDTQRYDFKFTQTKKALHKALDANQNVILTGDFSEELDDSLAPFLLARSVVKMSPGKLILVRDKALGYLDGVKHAVCVEEKIEALKRLGFSEQDFSRIEQENPQAFEQYDFNQLKTRIFYLKRNPYKHSNQAWYGFETLPSALHLKPFDANTSAQDAQDFIERRSIGVLDALQLRGEASPIAELSMPYVFLAGLTGVGKTTSVEQIFSNTESILFNSERQLLNWATTCDGLENKILFIDEANLSITQWSQFEGLFHQPPSILIDGECYELTPKHKVIFAGNPLSYGDDRSMARLFQRHGNAWVFDPLPTAFIHENIIKPVFETSLLNARQVVELSQELLAVYQFIAECSRDEVLISAREVQMMALLVNHYLREHRQISAERMIDVAKYYARSIGLSLVPASHVPHFNHRFPPVEIARDPIVIKYKTLESSLFVNTPSREGILYTLHDFISLQGMRRNNKTLNDAQAYGGLGGMILEGEPGIGKSEMVVQYLVSQGIHEADIASTTPYAQHMFYRIPISMELDTKKKLLLKAFDEGSVVVMDEINSAPMMEQWLNSLLMGKTPDGKRPRRAGFCVIGTQNPSTMPGRRQCSTALSRRMQTAYLSAYTAEEILDILQQKGVSSTIALELLQAFQKKSQEARVAHLNPTPTFRDLMNAADEWVKAHGRVSATDEPVPSQTNFTPLADPYKLTTEEISLVDEQFTKLVDDFSTQIHRLPLDYALEKTTSTLITQLNQKKLSFLNNNPTINSFEWLKQDSLQLIDDLEKKAHFSHTLFTTPILRELVMLLRGLKNLLVLLVCKPIYVLSNSNKKVFEHGLYNTFFCTPKTDITEEADSLKQGMGSVTTHFSNS